MNNIFSLCIIILSISFTIQQYNIDLSNLESNSMYTDIMNCMENEDLSTCSSVKMKSGVYQCCALNSIWIYYDVDGRYYRTESDDICSIWVSQDFSDDQIKSMEESYKETMAFLRYVYGIYFPSINYKYTCPKKTYTFNYAAGEYTQEEIEIIKDKNYCQRLYYEGLYELGYVADFIGDEHRAITKDDCMNAKMLPNSNSTCAYASFVFIFDDMTKQKVSTCLFVSSSSFQTKSLDQALESDFSKFSFSDFGDDKAVQSFEVEITNKNGNVLKYDSLSKTLVSKSENLSKPFLFLLSLLFLLF